MMVGEVTSSRTVMKIRKTRQINHPRLSAQPRFGAQPVLFDFTGSDGQTRPALAAGTKAGHVYLLDRETGEPLFPVEERAVPQEGAPPGE